MSVNWVLHAIDQKRGSPRQHQHIGKGIQVNGFISEQEKFRADVRGEHGDLPLVGFTFFEGLDFLDVDNIVRLHAEGLSYDDGAKFV